MKKNICVLICLIFLSNLAMATENVSCDEVKLDLKNLPYSGKKYRVKTEDEEEEEMYQQELRKQQLQESGQDYMYRKHQQMMTPMLHSTPFGGFMY